MKAVTPLLAVLTISSIAAMSAHAHASLLVLAVIVPYAAFAVFLVGFCYRVARWAWAPVPFRIPTTCGQQKSLPWIKPASLDNPSTGWGAVRRMALEILLFRSLFRDNRARLHDQRLVLGEDRYLWLGALAFHWSLLVILLRHLRLFLQPVPDFFGAIEAVDGAFEVGIPALYVSDVVILIALLYLTARRFRNPLVRCISLPICAWTSGLPPSGSGRANSNLSDSPASGQRPGCVFPLQQAHAHGRSVSQPYAQPGQQQSQQAPREPMESCSKNPLLCGMGKRIPRQTKSCETSPRD